MDRQVVVVSSCWFGLFLRVLIPSWKHQPPNTCNVKCVFRKDSTPKIPMKRIKHSHSRVLHFLRPPWYKPWEQFSTMTVGLPLKNAVCAKIIKKYQKIFDWQPTNPSIIFTFLTFKLGVFVTSDVFFGGHNVFPLFFLDIICVPSTSPKKNKTTTCPNLTALAWGSTPGPRWFRGLAPKGGPPCPWNHCQTSVKILGHSRMS